jgi:hypothetical protein
MWHHIKFQSEMISSESRASVLFLLNEVFKITKFKYKYCLYDDGCHLDESLKIHIHEYPELKDLIIYIDRFHIRNHVRNVINFIYKCLFSQKYFKLLFYRFAKRNIIHILIKKLLM